MRTRRLPPRSRPLQRHRLAAGAAAGILVTTLLTATTPASATGEADTETDATDVVDTNTVPVPPATVSGPIPTTPDSYPFLSSAGPELPPIEEGEAIEVDLDTYGYVEEEFLISGDARHYDAGTGEVVDTTPYTTRMVVRRPADEGRFDGTVVLEWNNVSAGYDLEIDWFVSNEHLMRNGHAWVGVSAQRVGVESLRAWDAERYGDLDVGDAQLSDAPSFDIFAQAAQTLRSPVGEDPLPGVDVDRIIATGHSQSAGRLAAYHNDIHPAHEVVDGFVIHGTGSPLRKDLTTPVMRLMAEGDVATEGDSAEADTDYFRRWEVAGTSHVGFKEYATFGPLVLRDLPGSEAPVCDRPPFSRIPFHHVQNAAYDHMVTWIDSGAAPPAAPRLDWVDGAKARDEYGNQLGGIQLSQHFVATAVNDGNNSGDIFCFLFGAHIPFDDDTLRELYPRHGDYVLQVVRASRDNSLDGYILPEAKRETIREAVRSGYGQH